MTRLHNDPATFTEDMLVGFLDANADYVAGVPGGVVRATATRPGKVAVVVGGGSGHYPAFCGVVGPGFADGAVVGNIFTSPSATEAASVARAAHGNADVVEAARASYEALTSLGGALPNDKTMLDAWLPFVETIEAGVAAGDPWLSAWHRAVEVCQLAAEATAELRPEVGRARPLAERSVGTADAGATSFAICVRVVADVLDQGRGQA